MTLINDLLRAFIFYKYTFANKYLIPLPARSSMMLYTVFSILLPLCSVSSLYSN